MTRLVDGLARFTRLVACATFCEGVFHPLDLLGGDAIHALAKVMQRNDAAHDELTPRPEHAARTPTDRDSCRKCTPRPQCHDDSNLIAIQ